MKKNVTKTKVEKKMELEVVEFSDLQQLEESIAPIFLLTAAAGGKCSGGSGSGCSCVVPLDA